jgi:hypothetical protein
MKKLKEFLGKPLVTGALFAVALALLLIGSIGGTRAALTIQSEYYNSEVEVLNIGVALVEKDADGVFQVVSGKDALMGENTPIGKAVKIENSESKKFYVGKKYPETLAVRNTADIDEYVRVAVYKYWLDENGNKFPEMDSQWIELGFVTTGNWSIDAESTTEERTVLYYSEPIAPGEDTTEFLESVSINKQATKKITKTETVEGNVTKISWTYDYNGKQFCLEVYVDSVQDHNPDTAKVSAWGVNK